MSPPTFVLPKDGFLFHDVAPLHVASLASLDDLKAKMARLSPSAPSDDDLASFNIRAFRPNVVVTSPVGKPPIAPWDEEEWSEFSIARPASSGGAKAALSFRLLKGCPRCTVPARCPHSGAFHFKSKPLLAPQVGTNYKLGLWHWQCY